MSSESKDVEKVCDTDKPGDDGTHRLQKVRLVSL